MQKYSVMIFPDGHTEAQCDDLKSRATTAIWNLIDHIVHLNSRHNLKKCAYIFQKNMSEEFSSDDTFEECYKSGFFEGIESQLIIAM